MKRSLAFLIILFLLLLSGLWWTNMLLRREYSKIDINDKYWSYDKILEKPFRFIRIQGGRFTRIAVESDNKPSVRIIRRWSGYNNSIIHSSVSKDTLILTIDDTRVDKTDQIHLQGATLLRIFTPELVGVFCSNANINIVHFPHQSVTISASGNSQLELELASAELNGLNVNLKDSSSLLVHPVAQPRIRNQTVDTTTIIIGELSGFLYGLSTLRLGHAQIKKSELLVADHAIVEISGNALNNMTLSTQTQEQFNR